MRRRFTLLLLWALTSISLSAFAQNTALKFNGTSNLVSTGANFEVGGSPTGNFTVEFWAFVPVLATDGPHEFMSQGDVGSSFGFYIGYDGANSGHLQAGDGWVDVGVAMPAAQWVHLALAFDNGVDTAAFYVNGVEVGSNNTGYGILTGSANFRMGVQTNGSGLLNGSMDQVKIWQTLRTAGQIKGDMYGSTDVSNPNLEAYYSMDEGSGTVVGNSSIASGLSGTLVGGSTSAWVPSPVQSGDNGLTFDGSAFSQVSIPNPGIYDLSSGTVEFWVNPSSLPGTSTVFGNRGAGGTRYSFEISSGSIGMTIGSASNTIPFSFVTGTWHHLAFVNDGTQSTVFVDGVNTGTIPGGFGGTTITLQPITLGVAKSSGADANPLNGTLDEVRVWSTQRTQTQIMNFMNNTMTGTESGLAGLFSFNQGIAGGDNTGLLTTLDNTSNNNHGTLSNFALTGTASNFAVHTLTPVTLPVTLVGFSAMRQNNQTLLRWQTDIEQNSFDFNIERSSDGLTYGAIGTEPAAGNSNQLIKYAFIDASPLTGTNYYRLKQQDLDGKFTYSSVQLVTFATIRGRLIWYSIGRQAVEVALQEGNDERYTLTDLEGRILRQGQLSNGKTNIAGYPAGVYIVNVMTSAGQMMNTRIVLP